MIAVTGPDRIPIAYPSWHAWRADRRESQLAPPPTTRHHSAGFCAMCWGQGRIWSPARNGEGLIPVACRSCDGQGLSVPAVAGWRRRGGASTLLYDRRVSDSPRRPIAVGAPERNGVGTYELMMMIGAELTELLERLVRRQSGMTLTQFRVLELAAAEHPNRLEPWQLGEQLGIASNHLSAVLDQLETRGFVHRNAHPNDGRRRLINITDAGMAQASRLQGLAADLQARIVGAGLTDAERHELERMLNALRTQISDVGAALRRRPGP